MQILTIDNVRIDGVTTCLPARSEDNLARCTEIYGSETKAVSIVKATGIRSRRVVTAGTSSLDLCVKAAENLLKGTNTKPEEIGAVIDVTFTPERSMPCNACQAQARLGIDKSAVAFDIGLACSGWAYGLYTASMFVKATGRKVLLLDGDVQTPRMDPMDLATVPVLADAGTATLLAPCVNASSWSFAFLSDGAKGEALKLPFNGTISMDGFGVFKFVTMDVLNFIREFMTKTEIDVGSLGGFVPHQANIFMIQQIAKKLKLNDKIWISGDVLGNSASATVPTTIAYCGREKMKDCDGSVQLLISGFGGGLSASVGRIALGADCYLNAFDFTEE